MCAKTRSLARNKAILSLSDDRHFFEPRDWTDRTLDRELAALGGLDPGGDVICKPRPRSTGFGLVTDLKMKELHISTRCYKKFNTL